MKRAKAKRYIVVPRDAMEVLDCRCDEMAEAKQKASELCAESGQAHYILETKAVATRENPPVKVRLL